MKKSLCILKWSGYFAFLIAMLAINIIIAATLPKIQLENSFMIIVLYSIISVDCILYYSKFYSYRKGMKILEIIPVSRIEIMKMYQVSKLILVLVPTIISTVLLLIKDCKMGLFIIPNALIMLGIDWCVNKKVKEKKLDEEKAEIKMFFISEVTLSIIFLIEVIFVSNVLN